VRNFLNFPLAFGATLLACAPRADEFRVDPARECKTAAQLRAPSEAGGPHMSRTLWRVHECPEQASAIVAELLSGTRLEQDTTAVQLETSLTQYVHDARVLGAALALATDSAATVPARLGALRALLWAKAPGHPYYSLSALMSPAQCVRPRCSSSYTSHFYRGGPVAGDTTRWPVFGRRVPARYVTQIDSAAALVEHDPSTPESVRAAARHVRLFPPDPELMGR
jgi:hypothetical protein